MSNFDIRFFWTSKHLDYIISMLTNLRKSRLTKLNQKIKSKEKSKREIKTIKLYEEECVW